MQLVAAWAGFAREVQGLTQRPWAEVQRAFLDDQSAEAREAREAGKQSAMVALDGGAVARLPDRDAKCARIAKLWRRWCRCAKRVGGFEQGQRALTELCGARAPGAAAACEAADIRRRMAENEAAAVAAMRAVGGSASYDFLATNAALVAGPHSPHGLAPPATSAHDPVALVKEHYRAGRDSPGWPLGSRASPGGRAHAAAAELSLSPRAPGSPTAGDDFVLLGSAGQENYVFVPRPAAAQATRVTAAAGAGAAQAVWLPGAAESAASPESAAARDVPTSRGASLHRHGSGQQLLEVRFSPTSPPLCAFIPASPPAKRHDSHIRTVGA